MVCIYCGQATRVVNSRHQRRTNHIWRRRKCAACGGIFTTQEHIELSGAFVIQKESQGRLHPFSRDTLFLSIYESCRHRTTATEDAAALTQTILARLLPLSQGSIIARKDLIATSLLVLERFDKAASTFYGAYHPL